MALSKRNTDLTCFNNSPSIFRRFRLWLYIYHIWTGLYVMERHERFAYHGVKVVFLMSSYYIFREVTSGFIDGWSSFGEKALDTCVGP